MQRKRTFTKRTYIYTRDETQKIKYEHQSNNIVNCTSIPCNNLLLVMDLILKDKLIISKIYGDHDK